MKYKYSTNTENIQLSYIENQLTHFRPVSHFYTPWKRQKIFGFVTFSGGIEKWHWPEMD